MARLRWILALGALGVAAGFFSENHRQNTATGIDAARRGRHAETPAEMTPLGWKDILVRTYHESNDDRLFSVAAGVAFFTLLALVPALTALISLYGLLASPATIMDQLGPMLVYLPGSARDLVSEQAVRLAAQPNAALSVNLVISIALALWGANAAIKALFDALNVIYDEVEKRSLIKLNAVSLATTFSAMVLMIVMIFLIAILPTFLKFMPFSNAFEVLVRLLRWPLFYILASLAIAVLYWIGPSRRPMKFVWVLPGALLAALLWAIVSAGFSWYVATMNDYTATYGSLAAVIVFMTWLWLSASVILIGAELNSELEHQTARDSTIGLPKPMGLRGAEMADSLGPAVAKA